MATGRDVAERAGTSTAVVSYVFNNGPRNVSPATRERVLRAAAEETITHWRRRWSAVPDAFNWLGGRVIYHEVCVVRVGPTELRIYDPTEGVWLEPELRAGHGAQLAIRAEIPQAMTWGPHVLVSGQWTEIAPDA